MTRSEMLDRAKDIVTGHREQEYGSPEDNFSMIGNLWSIYLGQYVSASDVAMMMSLMKIARSRTGEGSTDCFVDLAGYAACACEIYSRKIEEKIND